MKHEKIDKYIYRGQVWVVSRLRDKYLPITINVDRN